METKDITKATVHLKIALGSNMNVSSLTPLAITEIMEDYHQSQSKQITDNSKVNINLLKENESLQQRIKELEEVITKALNISHLWTYSDTISESQEQEAQALRSMEDSFQTTLNNKQ